MQIQISWLLQKPTDLDLHCLQFAKTGHVVFSKRRVNVQYSTYHVYPKYWDILSRNHDESNKGVVGWCEGAVYLTSLGRPTDIGLQLGKACYPCSG